MAMRVRSVHRVGRVLLFAIGRVQPWSRAGRAGRRVSSRPWAATLGRIATHNAYHTGQILLLRKMQGAWDPAKGVK